jgi:alkylated DNA repair dioxygenase AlkB
MALRLRVEESLGCRFNSVLCNLYRDGRDSMGMHSDSEPELGPEPVVASLSLGASRRFQLRHKGQRGRANADTDPTRRLDLELHSGSLLLMGGKTQRFYRHGVPRQASLDGPRINLTFRLVQP